MSNALRCATYARYSSDQQREASIADQQRNMEKYASERGWRIVSDCIFSDVAMSGAGIDRPGLQALLSAAETKPRRFDAILVDDTSRIGRSLADTVRIRENLSFAGIRLIAVSQGIDSNDEQADVMMTVHSLVDGLYLKELAKKTHRGLEGLALQKLHTGGNCYGYQRAKVGERVRLEIDAAEANILVRIFEMAASGMSLKKMAKTLNQEGVAPPRGTKRKIKPSWVYTAIREMLRRELYIGRLVWNKRKYIKKPGSNKRVSIPRPERDWTVVEAPELRIISEELWARVQNVIAEKSERFSLGHAGLMNRAASSKYLFSGLLKCSECGSNLTILAARGPQRNVSFYGCPGHLHRGICENDTYVRRDLLEQRLLQGVQSQLQNEEIVSYIVSQLRKDLEAERSNSSFERDCKQRDELRVGLSRLADAIAEAGHSDFLLEKLQEKEKQLALVNARIANANAPSVADELEWLKQRIASELSELPSLLNADSERARTFLRSRIPEIHMTATREEGEKFYVAEGAWFIGGNTKTAGAELDSGSSHLCMVAGAGFEPATFGL